MKYTRSAHYDWMQLIEVSGPFLSATVLDGAFSTGFEGLDKRVKRELSHYYDEWVEAVETKSPQMGELHHAWCVAVLRAGLGFLDGDLREGGDCSVAGEGGLGRFAPDFTLNVLGGPPALFVLLLPPDAKPDDRDLADEWKDTFVEKMTRLCRAHNVRLGLVTNGELWTLVNAGTGGTLSGTATWHARLWFQEDSTLRAFCALLGYRRFTGSANTRLPYLLDESLKHLEEVTDTLGRQVMLAVEVLLEGLDRADLDSGRTLLANVPPRVLYEASLTVMMRLVFILCAEERGLLLLGEKTYDDVYAISTLRKQLEEDSDKFGPQVLECRHDAWSRLLATFRAIYAGIDHPALKLPAMGGSLFDPDKFPFLEGRSAGMSWTEENPPPLPIDNRTVLLLLESLQVLKHKDGAMPLSFRSLDVEQIGYVYEGLLEATAKKADDLLLGLKGDKSHPNPEVNLAELESLALDDQAKLIARIRELTGRSESALKNEWNAEPDPEHLPQLTKVCRGNEALKDRIKPYLNWMRLSAWGEPVVYHPGTFYVASGQDRRASGAHYTPKQLTEMIVKEALEPVVYVGPAEGKPRGEWTLKPPAELLALKICDIAMGSGAFLVQVCRYLADRLVDAWAIAEKNGKVIASDGTVTDFPPNEPLSNVPDDRLCEARRLVAEKCLYGVDINPLAVELAKLSLWLVTISKGRPFGFLDHNLKSGDSLLGVTDVKQLTTFRMKPDAGATGNLMTASIENAVAQAAVEREAIQNARTLDIRDIQLQMQHHRNVEKKLANARAYADYFIGEVFVLGKTTDKNGKITSNASKALDAAAVMGGALLDPQSDSMRATQAKQRLIINLSHDLPAGQTAARRPFHWALEFPEVFAQGGFDAIVGNPPFSGGRRLKESFSESYHSYVVHNISLDGAGAKNADLCSFFFLRAYALLKFGGVFDLIASNSIAEGDTRQTGLEALLKHNAKIISAYPNMPWPGVAAVFISPCTVVKQDQSHEWRGLSKINNNPVSTISSFLSAQDEWSLRPLERNKEQSFQGSLTRGKYFIVDETMARQLIAQNAKNRNVLYPYLTGEDLNSSIDQSASRWVINFWDWPLSKSMNRSWHRMNNEEKILAIQSGEVPADYPYESASDYPEVLNILQQRCQDENPNYLNNPDRPYWWQFWCPRPELYHTIGRGHNFVFHPDWWNGDEKKDSVCAVTRVSKTLAFAMIPNESIFSDATVILTRRDPSTFGVLQSCFHAVFAWKYSSKMKTDLRYAPNDCYKTFPFPVGDVESIVVYATEFTAKRTASMKLFGCGLTALYKKFHDKEICDGNIKVLRELQVKIDNAVRDAYGWTDLDLAHGFHEVEYLPANDNVRYTISEEARIEVLKRLAKLNKERWEEEEAAGLHKKGKKK